MRNNRMSTYLAIAAIAAAVMFAVGAPIGSLLPFGLLLLCPLMMVFMMRGMAGQHVNKAEEDRADGRPPDRVS